MFKNITDTNAGAIVVCVSAMHLIVSVAEESYWLTSTTCNF